jgi:hypothetical protein
MKLHIPDPPQRQHRRVSCRTALVGGDPLSAAPSSVAIPSRRCRTGRACGLLIHPLVDSHGAELHRACWSTIRWPPTSRGSATAAPLLGPDGSPARQWRRPCSAPACPTYSAPTPSWTLPDFSRLFGPGASANPPRLLLPVQPWCLCEPSPAAAATGITKI